MEFGIKMGFGGIWVIELGRNGIWWDLDHKLGRKMGFRSWNWGEKWDLSLKQGIKCDLVGFGSWNWGEKWDLLVFGL